MKKNSINKVLNIISIVLGVILVISVVILIFMAKDATNPCYSEDAYYQRMREQAYGDMLDYYYEDKESAKQLPEDMKEYYAVARYFEGAFYYKMYLENGDLKRADKQLKKMETAQEEMGVFESEKEKIDEILGL